MGQRRDRLDTRIARHTAGRRKNSVQKEKFHDRQDARMLETVKSGDLPFTQDVMSWLSRKLDKKSTRITREDIKALV